MVNSIIAKVSTSEEDEIRVQETSENKYSYSFYSKGRQEFLIEHCDFEFIETSIMKQFHEYGRVLIDKIKLQLGMF